MISTRLLLGTVLALQVGVASAVTITTSASSTGNNVVFNSCSGASQSASTLVQGCLNGQPSTLVNFSDDSTLTVNGGQARIQGGSSFNSLTVGFAAPTAAFTALVMNIRTDDDNEEGFVRFVVDFFGSTPDWTSGTYFIDEGSNFFTLTAGLGEFIDTVRVESVATGNTVRFDDVRQVRLSNPVTYVPTSGGPGGASDPVPAPGTLALLGAGLAALGLRRQRQA